MKLKYINISVVISIISLFSCEEFILEEEIENTPEINFEILWNDFNDHYSLFEVREHSWNSIYELYRPQISRSTTNDELWQVFKEMISYLDDSHVFILNPQENFNEEIHFFASGSEENDLAEDTFDLSLIEKKYIENIERFENEEEAIIQNYGNIKNENIGYVYLNSLESDDFNFMDLMLRKLKNSDAIILDLRNNAGGSDVLASKIAGRFATSEKLIYTVEEKNGPNINDFGNKINYYSKKEGEEFYSKPLVVLTDKITVSAAEILLLHLNSFDQVTQIGNTTAGDFSDGSMRRFLPNGWQYQYSIFKFLLPNGTSLNGVGHIPDILIINTANDIKNEEDKVLEKAIEYLKKTL